MYRELLEELLDEENITASQASFYLTPDWAFDILHEFVYQFQGFCQFRAAVYASAQKYNIDIDKAATVSNTPPTSSLTPPQHLKENVNQITQNTDAWVVETVIYYLNRLIQVGKKSKFPGYQFLGVFASIALSRLECLLGDYESCLSAASSMMNISIQIPHSGTATKEEITTGLSLVQTVIAARLSHAYHMSVSLLMTRRYQWCIKLLGETCTFLQRGFKTGQFRKLPGSDQFSKLHDRMVALLAIVTHICPPGSSFDETLLKTTREKHGAQLAKTEEGLASYESLFCFGCPKFITPTAVAATLGDNYKLQVNQFNKQMAAQQESLKLRSYMKLYTSIETQKLAAFHDQTEEAFTSLLLSYKYRMRQEEADGEFREALDIHYHLNGKMVNIDEAEKERRFEDYFMKQIRQNVEIRKDIAQISTLI